MPKEIFNLSGENSVSEFSESVRRGIPTAVFGVNESFKNYLAGQLSSRVLLILKDDALLDKSAEYIRAFTDKKTAVLTHKDDVLTFNRAFYKDLIYKRLVGIKKAFTADVIIATPYALMQKFPKEIFSFTFKKGEEYKREDYLAFFIKCGYARQESAENKGTFCLRGDMLEVFPVNSDCPVRIDFFGDTVESIKYFDPETRKNLGFTEEAEILQAAEIVFSDEDYGRFYSEIKKDLKAVKGEAAARLKDVAEDLYPFIENKSAKDLAEFCSLSLNAADFTSLLKEDFTVIIDEPKAVYESARLYYTEFSERFKSLFLAGEVFSFEKNNLMPVEEFKEKLCLYGIASVQNIASSTEFFSPLKIINPVVGGVANYKAAQGEFFSDVFNWLKTGYKVIICADKEKNKNIIEGDLYANKLAPNENLSVILNPLPSGFIFHEKKTVIIGSGNLFTGYTASKKPPLKNKGFFTAPAQGDYCVHEIHGVGRVIGNKKISSSEGTKDYVAVEYYGNDILYIPVEQMDILTRYLGGEKTPKLSKLGGKDFDKIKEAVKASIKKMSFDLKKLYEERNSAKGYSFEPYRDLTELFINEFEFTDTPDQRVATEEVFADMQSDRVMDRLICGDVGFGKTEVAFRAVFLAVANGKQAAMLAPTTILTEQHYETAVKRFKNFGLRIAVINRFKTQREQKEILQKVKNGEIDFLIGTHRLLSGDISFKDLGLLVLDEEQRFGVEHKEKIKLLKNDVDALTLTATPIPRTLHMSLSGIRPISSINTPPESRLPVQTYVLEETDALIKDAVMREINRGGQAFILYNRVASINAYAEKIKNLIPASKITVVHGQMEERLMEKNVLSFYRGESNVLVSTTIIENGIDLPKANTLIVTEADKLGLSTLYQLKGRVGRSNRLAYAYFTYKRDKVLTKNAYDRLEAITEFAEMGSGIKIAMRDLEIRGAGNVLGAEQHGHMDKIGYELYAKLLKEELSGEEDVIADVDVRVSAFIPDGYIEGRASKMDAYKEIAEIKTLEDEKSVREILKENYGEIPKETDNLINISVVKSLAKQYGASAIKIFGDAALMEFADYKIFGDKKLAFAMQNCPVKTKIVMSGAPAISFERGKNNAETLYRVKNFLVFAESGDIL